MKKLIKHIKVERCSRTENALKINRFAKINIS